MRTTLTLDVGNTYLPDYTYKIDVMDKINLERDYYGLSLEEIEKKHGKEIAVNVYWNACHGVDLTKIPPSMPHMKVRVVVDFSICYGRDFIEIHLMHNKYTAATRPL